MVPFGGVLKIGKDSGGREAAFSGDSCVPAQWCSKESIFASPLLCTESSCLSLLSFAGRNTMTKSNWERKGWSDYSLSLRTSQKEGTKQGGRWGLRRAAHCLASRPTFSHLSCTFLVLPWTTCLEVALPTLGWILPHQSTIKKIINWHAHRLTNLMRHFLNWGSLLPHDSSLCQVNRNQPAHCLLQQLLVKARL